VYRLNDATTGKKDIMLDFPSFAGSEQYTPDARQAIRQDAAAGSINRFIDSLSNDERHAMKMRLSDRISSFFDGNNLLRSGDDSMRAQFDILASTLHALTPNAHTIPANGVAYRGYPAWLTPNLLRDLQQEAEQRRELPLDRIDHFLGCGGRCADVLSVSPNILDFVSAHVGPVQATGIASYLYYDRAGLGIRPHVDTEVFSVNMMLMLRHDCPQNVMPSATVVFPAYRDSEHYRLQIGEVMLMHGSSVIHTRSLVQPGENIHLLTIGFNRI
jgi:hypothetical protein